MRYVFDLASCVAEERDGKLVVHTEPEDENSRDHAVCYLNKAFQGCDELRTKAAAAMVMAPSIETAAEWLQECEEAHIPGDCPLCGAV